MRKSKTSVKIPVMDLCQTPGYAVEPLQNALEPTSFGDVWEPASGEGYLARALDNMGCLVWTSDIDSQHDTTHGEWDFLGGGLPDTLYSFDSIITNPPFSLKKEFAERALEWRKLQRGVRGAEIRVALLMQTEVVSTKWFWEKVVKYGEPGIIWFNPRINFKMPNKGWEGAGSHFSTAWFTWGWFTGNQFVRMDHWTKEYRQGFEI